MNTVDVVDVVVGTSCDNHSHAPIHRHGVRVVAATTGWAVKLQLHLAPGLFKPVCRATRVRRRH